MHGPHGENENTQDQTIVRLATKIAADFADTIGAGGEPAPPEFVLRWLLARGADVRRVIDNNEAVK